MNKAREVAPFTSSDLQNAGINSQLTSNDLIEVVANDIYDKYVDAILDATNRGKELQKEYASLFDDEINKMKVALKKYLPTKEKEQKVDDEDIYEDEVYDGVTTSFGKSDKYWSYISVVRISLREKDRGTAVERDTKSLNIPNLKQKTAAVKLSVTVGNQSETEDVKVGNITGTVQTSMEKHFSQVINVSTARFKKLSDKVSEHNKQVDDLLNFLPKNGLLSVDRFTREARVKMNKKIISAQSPEFRKKISELFNIKL